MEQLGVLRYLARPLQAAPLILVVLFSFLLAIGVTTGIFGILLVFVICSWFFKYAFMLLDHVADGRPDAPVLTAEAANPAGESRPLLYLFAAITFYAATAALQKIIGPDWTSAVRLVGVLSLPAIVGAQEVSGSFVRALNPVATVAMAWRLGAGYLLVIGVAAACWVVGRFIVLEAGGLALALRLALLMLLWLMMFSVLGGVIFEYRHEIGFEAAYSPERLQERRDAERDHQRDRLIDRIFSEFRGGNYSSAWETLQRHIRESAAPLDEYAWIYARVAAWPTPKMANRVAQEMFPLLLAAKKTSDALRIVKERIRADADFRPTSSEQLIKLAQLARDGGDRPLARALLHDFAKRYPSDPLRGSAQRLTEELARR